MISRQVMATCCPGVGSRPYKDRPRRDGTRHVITMPCVCVRCATPQALASQEAELGELHAKYGALTRQYDEAVHKVNLAKQVGAGPRVAVPGRASRGTEGRVGGGEAHMGCTWGRHVRASLASARGRSLASRALTATPAGASTTNQAVLLRCPANDPPACAAVQARERAQAEVHRKEEEAVALEVGLPS